MKKCGKLCECFLVTILLCSIGSVSNAQKIEANNPLPDEYLTRINQVYLEPEVMVWESKFLITSSTHNAAASVGLAGVAFVKMASNVLDQLESELPNSIPVEEDTVLLKKTIYNACNEILSQTGATENSDTDLKLRITLIDHGFHWATSSALGVYIRIKADLLSDKGELLWEQIYFMDKDEKKIPYNKKAINVKRAVEALLIDYKADTDLLGTTYEQICEMLAAKLISGKD